MQTAGGIYDEHVTSADHRLFAGFFDETLDGRGIRLGDFALINLRLDSLCDNFQLLARGRAIDVHGNQQRTMAAVLEPVRQLA